MSSNRGRILVVDDDDDCRRLITSLLGRLGYETREAATGDAAIDAVHEERPALVIVEVLLPGASGYEVCREVKDAYGDEVPVMFVSGDRSEPADQAAGFLVGGDDYVVKPFVPDVLLARVRRLVRGSNSGAREETPRLTAREQEVLAGLLDGRRNAEIATDLGISARTVGKHVENVMTKLHAHTRAEAVARALREGLAGGGRGGARQRST